ncbi:MAG: metallophosphoesterase [Bacteroidales bacterium]|nr:metallophosphoesterase [Bacteroidales bacterium]
MIYIILSTIITLLIFSDISFYSFIKKYLTKSVLIKRLWILQTVVAVLIITSTIIGFTEVKNIETRAFISPLILISILFILPKIFFLIYWIIGIMPLKIAASFKKKKAEPSKINSVIKISSFVGAGISLMIFFSIIYGGTIGINRIVSKDTSLYYDRLPKSFENLKIVHFSDLHIGGFKNNPDFIERLVKKINDENADIIIFSGDLVNDHASEIEPYKNILSNLKSKYGIYSSMGNHDYGPYYRWHSQNEKKTNIDKVRSLQNYMGWKLLDNSAEFISNGIDSIAVIGVENWGEPPFSRYGDLSKAMEDINSDYFSILISHNPVHWRAEVVDKTNIDLTLSGHTHAMQIEIGFGNKKISPSSLVYKEWGGIYKSNNQILNVNTGIGFVGFPLRIGATPEISVITLHSK